MSRIFVQTYIDMAEEFLDQSQMWREGGSFSATLSGLERPLVVDADSELNLVARMRGAPFALDVSQMAAEVCISAGVGLAAVSLLGLFSIKRVSFSNQLVSDGRAQLAIKRFEEKTYLLDDGGFLVLPYQDVMQAGAGALGSGEGEQTAGEGEEE